jgi:hypothetical protein
VCPIGHYCPLEATVTPKKCPGEKYCPVGTYEPKICPDGTYAPDYIIGLEDVTQCVPCKPGRYCINGEYDKDKLCDAGYFCDSGAAKKDDINKLCPAGFFCMQGETLPQKCERGKFSDKGAKSADDCTECKQGFYCPEGST